MQPTPAGTRARQGDPLRNPAHPRAVPRLCDRILRPRYAFLPLPYGRFTRPASMLCPSEPREHGMLSDIIFILGGLAVFLLAGLALRGADRL